MEANTEVSRTPHVEPWLRPLLDRDDDPSVEDLAHVLGHAGEAEAWVKRARFDEAAPYGRRVIVAEPPLEVMVAAWSRNVPCDPHDHGSGLGTVLVLQGLAWHKTFTLEDGLLWPRREQYLRPGDRITCPRGLIHQMADAGAPQPLVTLHLYYGCAAPMAVYDLPSRRTLWLRADAGAWRRRTSDPEVLGWAQGLVERGPRLV